MNNIYTTLSEPFSPEIERTLKKGGAYLTYIPVSEVINRLNKVLGVENWSFVITKCERDSIDTDFIVAHVSMTAVIHDETNRASYITRDGIGGQRIKRTKSGEIVDLGDEMKGAVSDALKKAAQTLGVGLYLARSEDAIMQEIADETVKPVVSAEISEAWDNFISLSKSLTKEQRDSLNQFWSTYSGGRDKPTKVSASITDIEALVAECVRLSFEANNGKPA